MRIVWHKRKIEFSHPCNNLIIRIARKVMSGFRIETVLYDLSCQWRWLRPEDVF